MNPKANNSSTDTQWPRWEVFKQDSATKPHQGVGSVHAGDGEHALLTARNVFARRPNAVSMWVVPAEKVFSATAEEVAKNPDMLKGEARGERSYLIFQKTGHRRSMTFVEHLGQLKAASPEHALKKALETFPRDDVTTWWIVPKDAIIRSDENDTESWFAPAKTKTYKQQSAYGQIGAHPSERKQEVADGS